MTTSRESEILRQSNLRYLLNQWDPIGVADLVDDEYDCLVAPIWTRLIEGATVESLSEFLWFETQDHLGLDPQQCGTDGFAEKLIAWYAQTD